MGDGILGIDPGPSESASAAVGEELNLDPTMARRAARNGSGRRLREAGFPS